MLDDQVDALEALAERDDRLDLDRVAIRGWSFGGYLAALAVLRRPDRFHAAVAGAPVTDWRLYDTHYTERYLGHPDTDPDAYARCDLTAEAAALTRPLLLVHGLADDNVVAAHTLKLSQALLEAGRPHEVLPLSGVTHMTPQEEVAENLLILQLDFIRRSLGLEPAPTRGEPMTGPLAGLRVVEGSAFVAAPSGGMALAQLGADVIRFDAIGGGIDHTRWPVTDDGVSIYWAGSTRPNGRCRSTYARRRDVSWCGA